MAPAMHWTDWFKASFGSSEAGRALIVDVLRRRYVREKQQVMRYRQHAERIHYPQFRDALLGIAAEEEEHAKAIGAKIIALGGTLPEVIPIHVPREQNSWFYLRTDLEEERHCAGELHDDLPALGGEFAEIADLLARIERDGRRHRAKLRDMIARSDPQSAGPP